MCPDVASFKFASLPSFKNPAWSDFHSSKPTKSKPTHTQKQQNLNGFGKRCQLDCPMSKRGRKSKVCFCPGPVSSLGRWRQLFDCSGICPQALLDKGEVSVSGQVQPYPTGPIRLISGGELSQRRAFNGLKIASEKRKALANYYSRSYSLCGLS